jgi:hypothetical protein
MQWEASRDKMSSIQPYRHCATGTIPHALKASEERTRPLSNYPASVLGKIRCPSPPSHTDPRFPTYFEHRLDRRAHPPCPRVPMGLGPGRWFSSGLWCGSHSPPNPATHDGHTVPKSVIHGSCLPSSEGTSTVGWTVVCKRGLQKAGQF